MISDCTLIKAILFLSLLDIDHPKSRLCSTEESEESHNPIKKIKQIATQWKVRPNGEVGTFLGNSFLAGQKCLMRFYLMRGSWQLYIITCTFIVLYNPQVPQTKYGWSIFEYY